ncbi:hypothetical protein V8C26DRAFT_405382, partial [Trichoderma gracile]
MGPPKPPVPHVAPIYRVTATALGAGMWFWLMYRAKKDGKDTQFLCKRPTRAVSNVWNVCRPRVAWVETSLGPLDDSIRSRNEMRDSVARIPAICYGL